MASNESTQKTLTVAFLLCIVCSLIVAGAAVSLKPMQLENKALDRKKNILAAAGLLEADRGIEEQFARVQTRIVDLDSGRFTDAVAVEGFDQRKVAGDPAMSIALTGEQDLPKIQRRENYSVVYLVEENGELDKLILPIRGYGLWSTLYGFIALENDGNTVAGLGFYEHAETPGLGGEVDNPGWKGQFPGKLVYRDGEAALALLKGKVDPASSNAAWQVDGLAGATLTGVGVSNLLRFWLGEMGFQKFIENLSKGEA